MEVDSILVARFIPKATAAYFDCLDPAVNTFGCTIASCEDDGIKNAPEMLLDGPGNFSDRF